jgi:uncharacterized protein (DUF362 family)
VDCFVSVPVLKAHVMTMVSLGIKNLWGCYPDTMRGLHHKYLSYKLALLTKLLDPKIILIDGTYALTGHGPMYGTAQRSNVILSADNAVVSDSLGANVMGLSPMKSEHIIIAEKEGLGITDLTQVKINQNWRPFTMQFSINKTFIDRLSAIPFNSETLAKLILDSPCTPMIYGLVRLLRTGEEQAIANDILRWDGNKR